MFFSLSNIQPARAKTTRYYTILLTEFSTSLLGTDDLRVHSHEVVVDGVLLLLLRFLYHATKRVVSK